MQNSKVIPFPTKQWEAIKKQRSKASKALSNARQRCTNPKDKDFGSYGAVGIQVLLSLDQLIAAIGYPPHGSSLDRIDPNGHYEVGNVRWASKAVQAANKKASPSGSTISVQSLIAQQKLLVKQEAGRPITSEAWSMLTSSFNRGFLSHEECEFLGTQLHCPGCLHASFDLNQVIDHGNDYGFFHLPALTLPGSRIRVRGGPFPCCNHTSSCSDLGRIHGLVHVPLSENIPPALIHGLQSLVETESQVGLTWIGRPAPADLLAGWFEGWMLTAASRMPKFGVSTAIYPVLVALERLSAIGPPSCWDIQSDSVLDVQVLFIPDLQLDCGDWGQLKAYQLTMIERLIDYRMEMGHKTVVGLQNPHKLAPRLQKLFLGNFETRIIASGHHSPHTMDGKYHPPQLHELQPGQSTLQSIAQFGGESLVSASYWHGH